MKNKIEEYKRKLEKELCEYMKLPVSERSASAVRGMAECWAKINEMSKCMTASEDFPEQDIQRWNDRMVNEDGTTGGHWSEYQTTPLAAAFGISPDHVSDAEWNVTMNMMYSDYCMVASKYGVNNAEFFADMARAFLFDKDAEGPGEKLAAYYHSVVKG